MSDPKGGDASPAKKYRFRVDVAKPAELYKPTFGPSRTSPSGASGKGTPLGFFPGTPLAPDDSRPIEPAVLRALEGGKRNRKPVDRMPAGGIEVTPAAATSASLDKASGDGNGARIIQRILSRRVHEGGSTSYLIVWGNGQVTNATWHSRASLGPSHAPLLQQFDAAVKRVRLMGMRELEMAATSLPSLGLPHATYFKGISSKGADGTIRRAASPATLPLPPVSKPTRDRSKEGKPRKAATSPSATTLSEEEGPAPLLLPPQSRRGLASSLSHFLKRRVSTLYEDGAPVLLGPPGVDAVFEALAAAPSRLPEPRIAPVEPQPTAPAYATAPSPPDTSPQPHNDGLGPAGGVPVGGLVGLPAEGLPAGVAPGRTGVDSLAAQRLSQAHSGAMEPVQWAPHGAQGPGHSVGVAVRPAADGVRVHMCVHMCGDVPVPEAMGGGADGVPMEVDTAPSDSPAHPEPETYHIVHLCLRSLPRVTLQPEPPAPQLPTPPLGPALAVPQHQAQQALLMLQLQGQGQPGSQQLLAAQMQVQALHVQQVHALQLQQAQQQQHLQIQMQMQQMQQQMAPGARPWLPHGMIPPQWPAGMPGTSPKPQPGPPPVAATTPVALRPAAFASQIASALTLESLSTSKPACGLALKPRGVLLPTAPPGHSYAVGPRRGAYLVLQPVVDRDGTAVFPPPRPSHNSRQASGRSLGRQSSKHGGRQSPAAAHGMAAQFGLPYGMPHGVPHVIGMGYARAGAMPMHGYAPPAGQPPAQPSPAAAPPPGHASHGHAPHGYAAAPPPAAEAPQAPMADPLVGAAADAPPLPPTNAGSIDCGPVDCPADGSPALLDGCDSNAAPQSELSEDDACAAAHPNLPAAAPVASLQASAPPPDRFTGGSCGLGHAADRSHGADGLVGAGCATHTADDLAPQGEMGVLPGQGRSSPGACEGTSAEVLVQPTAYLIPSGDGGYVWRQGCSGDSGAVAATACTSSAGLPHGEGESGAPDAGARSHGVPWEGSASAPVGEALGWQPRGAKPCDVPMRQAGEARETGAGDLWGCALPLGDVCAAAAGGETPDVEMAEAG